MPPTSPVLGRIKAYAKDASGNLYEIGGGSSVQKLDDLGDVDVVTTPPQEGDTITWDPVLGQWVPGPGGTDEVMILGTTPTDPDLELWVDLNATQGPITGTLQGGPGITIGTSPDGLITEIRVDTGEGVIVNANGVSVNADMLTLVVDPLDDKLKLIAPIDALIDVDTTTTPPTNGQVLVWDSTALPAPGQWVPKDTTAGVDFVAGDGIIVDESQPPVVRFQVDVGAGIIHSPAGIRVNTDDVTLAVDPLDDKVKLIAGIDHLSDVDTSTTPPTVGQTLTWEDGLRQWIPTTLASAATIKPGPGINVDDQTNPAEILVSVDPGAGIVHSADGLAVNVDNVTIQVNTQDQIALKTPLPIIAAGPGIVADGVTNPPTVTISVDPGAGIVQSADGIAINADAVTLAVDPLDDKLKLIAGIDHLSDVDTTTVVPQVNEALVWDALQSLWVPGVPLTQGIVPKNPARVASVADMLLDGSVTVLDGITLVAGDRVLVKDQTNPVQNGLYDVVLAGAWTRSVDANTEGSIINGNGVFVSEGALYGGINFVSSILEAEAPWTPDVDTDLWMIFSSKLDIVGGWGLTLDAKTLNVGQGAGIHVDPDSVRVDVGEGIVISANGVAINADLDTIRVDINDRVGVNLGDGLISNANGVSVNVDNSTLKVINDEVIVDLGAAIVKTAEGIAVNPGLGIAVVADRVVLDRTYTDPLYLTPVQPVEPALPWRTWIDTSVVVPIP